MHLPRPMRLAVDVFEHGHALSLARHGLAQLGLHHFVPDCGVVAVGEAFGLGDRVLDHDTQFRIALLIRMRRRAAGERRGERGLSGPGANE